MQHADFLKIEFTGRIADTGQVFDFTQAEVARQEGILDPKKSYQPELVIIGAHMVIPGVEKQLLGMQDGEERRFRLEPADGFGARNPRLVKVFSMTHFLKQNISPVVGGYVHIEGLRGRIQSVSGGRVRVDFNHPLAGKPLDYWVKVVAVVRDPAEKVKELFAHFGVARETALADKVLTVHGDVPEPEQQAIREMVLRWVKDVREVSFAPRAEPAKNSGVAKGI
ncbi:MAG: peptidylprolyl isomerase [Candidatus Aenigmarchaeota archaeon]|nr:peptidylprolyl isomerase [Candidatus Aenigmarchaeota archaeon]